MTTFCWLPPLNIFTIVSTDGVFMDRELTMSWVSAVSFLRRMTLIRFVHFERKASVAFAFNVKS